MDELDLIRRLRDDAPDPCARRQALDALRARMHAADSPAPVVRRRRPRARWYAIGAGLAGAAALAIVLATGIEDASVRPVPATAKEALDRAATAAEDRPERLLAPGEYFYVRDRSAYVATNYDRTPWSFSTPQENETWTNRRGDGRSSERIVGATTFPGPRDRRRWRQAGRPELSDDAGRRPHVQRFAGDGSFDAGGSTLTYEQMMALPRDGEAMYRRLIELAGSSGPSPDAEAFTIIGDLLRSEPVPTHVRAGLYRATAYIKGVRYVGRVRDEIGRSGLAVELAHGGTHSRLVFDPQTSQVLAEQDVLTERVPEIDAGTGFIIKYRLVLEQGVVKSDRERP